MSIEGPFNTNLHLQRVSVATEDSSDSVVDFTRHWLLKAPMTNLLEGGFHGQKKCQQPWLPFNQTLL